MYVQPTLVMLSSEAIERFFEQLGRPLPDSPSRLRDWRARKMKDRIDHSPNIVQQGISSLCKELNLNLSARQACRLFHTAVGIGVKEYTHRARLAIARYKLRDSDVPVKLIAADLGYSNPSNFTRVFKKEYSLSPKQYRHIVRAHGG